MTSDIPSDMAQSVRTSRSSFTSSIGFETPSYYSTASNGDDYDTDGSNFAPLTPMTLSNSLPPELAGAIPLIDKFQVEGFLRAMHKQIHSAGKRCFFSKRSVGPQVREKFTFEDMLCFQKDPIPTSLLKINSEQVSRAVKMFHIILKYMGVDSSDRVSPTNLDERIELVGKLFKQALKRSALRDELFAQISKKTRNCPDRLHLTKAWELMYLCASCMPPSKDIVGYLSEYVHNVAHSVSTDSEVQIFALNTLNALKRSVKAGPRLSIPGREEIEALLTGKKLTTIVYFLDETFEEITYDMATTVVDAVEELAGIIKLSTFSSFSLFECRKVVRSSKSPEPGNEEYIGLDDNKYIGDLLAEFKVAKDRSIGEILHCKLTFKKKLFRESDEVVSDSIFVQLSYVQLQHDYILGNYPVGKDDAAQLSALQILVEIGFVSNPESCTDWSSLLERFLPRQIAITREKREWEMDILSRYQLMENLTKDDARQQFFRILRTLPYGNSIFFSVRKIDDPIELLPERIILGINKRGVHFFRPAPKEYFHSAELRDIMLFGSSNTAVCFKMRVAGVLDIFQFETKQGEEICVALQTHINDRMLRRYSRAQPGGAGSLTGDVITNPKPPIVDVNEKSEQDLSNALEESQKNASQENLTKEDALPYGNSVFFYVSKIDDPIGLLPERIILGINKRGVHFFRPVLREYLHSAELRDIMQFGSSNTAVFFKMRVAGVLHIFQFETKQGEEICVALQTHINDLMLRRYSKAQPGGVGSLTEDVITNPKPPIVDVNEESVQDLSNALEESQKNASQENLTKEDALPYGNSVFFYVRKIDDPIGLLPERIILGVNKRGVHFFRPVPQKYLHSAELRDIMQFGSSNTVVFFKMRLAGVLHVFQFETKQAEEICVALRTHINDVMLCRYSRSQPGGAGSMNGDVLTNPKPQIVDVNEKRVRDLSNALEESQKNASQVRSLMLLELGLVVLMGGLMLLPKFGTK